MCIKRKKREKTHSKAHYKNKMLFQKKLDFFLQYGNDSVVSIGCTPNINFRREKTTLNETSFAVLLS